MHVPQCARVYLKFQMWGELKVYGEIVCNQRTPTINNDCDITYFLIMKKYSISLILPLF